MNVEINYFGADFEEKGRHRMGSVGKKALTAVFDCLQEGIFLYATAVDENVDLLAVVAVDAWLADYERIAPVRDSVVFLAA